MADYTAAQRYARAFFNLCHEKDAVEVVQLDMAQVGILLKTSESFRDFLISPVWRSHWRDKTISRLLGDRVNALTVRFLRFLNHKKRLYLLPLIVESWSQLYHQHHGLTRVIVESAVPLKDDQLREISNRMATRIGRKITLSVEVNPALIGGFKLRVRDRIIDLSIEGQLQQLQKRLLLASPGSTP